MRTMCRSSIATVLMLVGCVVQADELQPQVRGPLPATAQSHPFGAADHTRSPQDLSKLGYVEEEYLFSGIANVYDWPAEGPAIVRTANAPYTARVVIRRPKDAKRFSGTAVVALLKPSNRMDLNIGWAISHEEWIRKGDAWVGITAKPISVVALQRF